MSSNGVSPFFGGLYSGNHRRPSMFTAKYRLREERKKVMKMSLAKIKRIEDPESFLRRSVLINNTMKQLQNDVHEEKMMRHGIGYNQRLSHCLPYRKSFVYSRLNQMHLSLADELDSTSDMDTSPSSPQSNNKSCTFKSMMLGTGNLSRQLSEDSKDTDSCDLQAIFSSKTYAAPPTPLLLSPTTSSTSNNTITTTTTNNNNFNNNLNIDDNDSSTTSSTGGVFTTTSTFPLSTSSSSTSSSTLSLSCDSSLSSPAAKKARTFLFDDSDDDVDVDVSSALNLDVAVNASASEVVVNVGGGDIKESIDWPTSATSFIQCSLTSTLPFYSSSSSSAAHSHTISSPTSSSSSLSSSVLLASSSNSPMNSCTISTATATATPTPTTSVTNNSNNTTTTTINVSCLMSQSRLSPHHEASNINNAVVVLGRCEDAMEINQDDQDTNAMFTTISDVSSASRTNANNNALLGVLNVVDVCDETISSSASDDFSLIDLSTVVSTVSSTSSSNAADIIASVNVDPIVIVPSSPSSPVLSASLSANTSSNFTIYNNNNSGSCVNTTSGGGGSGNVITSSSASMMSMSYSSVENMNVASNLGEEDDDDDDIKFSSETKENTCTLPATLSGDGGCGEAGSGGACSSFNNPITNISSLDNRTQQNCVSSDSHNCSQVANNPSSITSNNNNTSSTSSESTDNKQKFSCGHSSVFGELQSVVFHSLIASLES